MVAFKEDYTTSTITRSQEITSLVELDGRNDVS